MQELILRPVQGAGDQSMVGCRSPTRLYASLLESIEVFEWYRSKVLRCGTRNSGLDEVGRKSSY